jgi:4a-hydroxytetrahydrobiopterin dehydratase
MERYDSAGIESELRSRPHWRLAGGSLVRVIEFPDFRGAMCRVNQVAETAESLGHHPDILLQYNRLELRLRTHSADGITNLDFNLADAIDSLDTPGTP